jgi:hypothetical protein
MSAAGRGHRQLSGGARVIEEIDVVNRLGRLRQSLGALRLYALVDGAQYHARRGEHLQAHASSRALFSGTVDAGLAHAGPWLIDTEQAGDLVTANLAALEKQAPAVTWLIAVQDLTGLTQLLQLHLDTRLPDGRTALLRFWDPRVLMNLVELLGDEQRNTFFGHIHEWHLLQNQQRVWIGRHDAHAQ